MCYYIYKCWVFIPLITFLGKSYRRDGKSLQCFKVTFFERHLIFSSAEASFQHIIHFSSKYTKTRINLRDSLSCDGLTFEGERCWACCFWFESRLAARTSRRISMRREMMRGGARINQNPRQLFQLIASQPERVKDARRRLVSWRQHARSSRRDYPPTYSLLNSWRV